MRKKGIAKPEPNSGEKLVLVVRTRSPLEAYKMLLAGQPVDQTIGWYQSQTGDSDVQDVFMMDIPQKLRYINELKERVAIQRSDIEALTQEVNSISNHKQQQNERSESIGPKGKGNQIPESGTNDGRGNPPNE